MKRLHGLYALAVLAAGCTPGIDVRKDPGPEDRGIRFYRPKPYLLIEPSAGDASAKDAPPRDAGLDPRGSLFKVSLQYLPDFGEEYSARARTGLGTSKVKLTLDNGWNLTSVDQDLDSKTADNLGSLTNLLKAEVPGGLVPGPKPRDAGETAQPREFRVVASNVPIGYYESVVGRDPSTGRKQLYGFRYVGFLPFAPCPIQPRGGEVACCGDGSMPLYGLVFERGVMTFKPLAQFREAGHELIVEALPTPGDGRPRPEDGNPHQERKQPPPSTSPGPFQPGSGQGPGTNAQAGSPASRPAESTSIRIIR